MNRVVSVERQITELERLLNFAEVMKERIDRMTSQIELVRMVQSLVLISCLALSIYEVLKGAFSQANSEFLVLLTFSVVPIFLSLEFTIRQMKRRMKPDQLALTELLALIRETENALADSEQWGPLERAQFRIRLSRFDIGYKV